MNRVEEKPEKAIEARNMFETAGNQDRNMNREKPLEVARNIDRNKEEVMLEVDRNREGSEERVRKLRRLLEVTRNKDRNVNKLEDRKMLLLGKEVDRNRKRKIVEEWWSPSQKRSRNPSMPESEREFASVKNSKLFKTNILLYSHEPGPAGDACSEGQAQQVLEGEGDDRFVLENSDKPESPARIGTVQPYRQYTASLSGERNY